MKIHVDLNMRDERGRYFARRAKLTGDVSVGDYVLAIDDEGESYEASVVEVNDRGVWLHIDVGQYVETDERETLYA